MITETDFHSERAEERTEAIEAIEHALSAIEGQRREPDQWERAFLLQAISWLFRGGSAAKNKFSTQQRASVRASTMRRCFSSKRIPSKLPMVRQSKRYANTFGSNMPRAVTVSVQASTSCFEASKSRALSACTLLLNDTVTPGNCTILLCGGFLPIPIKQL